MNAAPTILVIFGATGDLTKKKLAPALFHLSKKGKLPEKFAVVGFARRPYSDEDFRKHLAEILKNHHEDAGKIDGEFLSHFTYVSGDLGTTASYTALQKRISEIEKSWGVCTNKLFYLAVTPDLYKSAFTHLAASGLTKPCSDEEGWSRVIVEKPFGKDAATAKSLDELLGSLFKEQQIYRIDHYLAKEMLQNIVAFRFSNNLLEFGWGRDTIEKIDIRLWEKIGVEERGAFYEGVGAFRDVGQNHLLQMLALVTMERPGSFEVDAIRKERAQLLKQLRIPTESEIIETSRRAQYTSYRTISDVDDASHVETYFQVQAELASPRFEGVPIMLESGKRMGEARKEIVVHLKHDTPCLCPQGTHYRNKVVFSLEPEERITFHFWAKKPGLHAEMEERTIEFLLRDAKEKHQYVEEYEKLLLDCISGDQALFVNTEEVRAMWRFTDPFIKVWQKNKVPLETYAPDTNTIARAVTIGSTHKLTKEIGLIGLGKMGKNMAKRLTERGWNVSAHDMNPDALKGEADLVGVQKQNTEAVIESLARPRVLWLMIPGKAQKGHAHPIDEVLFGKSGLAGQLDKGDIIIDGGNSFFEETKVRGKKLAKLGITFMDVGVSGGPAGARNGASLMIGGDAKTYAKLIPLFRDLAAPSAYMHVGEVGAGHFVKMVHNGIEYGMMQALAEGFAILKKSPYRFNLKNVATIYNHRTVIESRLVGWLLGAFNEFGEELKSVSSTVGHLGEGEWTIKTAKKMKIPAPIIEGSFKFRVQSSKKPSYTGKVLSALRNQFGGHSK